MARLARRESHPVMRSDVVEPTDVFGPIDRTFERMFDMWPTLMPFRRPMSMARHWLSEAFIPVDEYREDGTLVIRASLPGIDPEKDVELTVSEGMLHIAVERREEETIEKRGYVRQELQHGSYERTLPLPEGVTDTDVEATYKDGILEIRVPSPEPVEGKKIHISTT